MKTMKALSAALSLTLCLTSLSGMITVSAADGADTPAAVVQAEKQTYSYDDILEIGYGVRKLRSIFDANGLYEENGYKLWIEAAVRELLDQNKFPAVLLNADMHSVTEEEAAALRETNPTPTICPGEGGKLWTLDKPGYAIRMPWDRFNAKLKTVQGDDGKVYLECAAYPFEAKDIGEYTEMLTAMLNYLQLQPGFEGFAYEDALGRFYGTDAELGDYYKIPGLHGVDVISRMTTAELEKLFAANQMTEARGYQVWTDESVSALLESGKFPALVLYPDQIRVRQDIVDQMIAEAEADPNVTVLADEYNVMWDFARIWDLLDMPDYGYMQCWKSYKAEPGTYAVSHEYYCETAIVPLGKYDYSTYVTMLKNALNFAQTTTLFAGFCYENLDEPFYGQSKLLDEGYFLPGRNRFDVIRTMTTEEIEAAFRQDGKTAERGNKVYTKDDVLEMLDRGEFPSVKLAQYSYNINNEYDRQRILEANPDAVFTEDQGMCWSHDRLYQFLDMPSDRYTLKVKTVVVEPPAEHPNAVKDYYGLWVMIPNGAANMEEYAQAVADALNIVQIYGQSLEICTEKMNEDFFGSDTVPENQYQLPAAADSVQLLPVSKIKAGDVNGDGSADVADAVLIARFVAEDAEVTITEKGLAAADVDGSGTVTQDDITMLLKHIAKKI
ncbi:MAG: dockerin type I repeat-containing protein [Oscillospiraceae bacterium]|nr:dockerin type I repeat-containing protein [Oscillospiraceae bacterium]